jgi:type VI secretion system protein ImpH
MTAQVTLGETLTRDASRYAMLPTLALLEHFAILGGAPPLGEETAPADAAVTLTARAMFGFPASEIDRIALTAPGRSSVRGPGFGLLGHVGPLPDWITEELAERARRGDRAATDFLAMFEQRLMTVAFRARSRIEPGFAYRTPEASGIGIVFRALLGLATPGLRQRMALPDRALLGFAGLLAGQSHSIGALERVLRTYLSVPVSVLPFTGRWLALEPADITLLGGSVRNNRLGRGAMLGARVWDRQSCFTLRVGPLDPDAFASLLPGGDRHRALATLTRFIAGPGLEFQLELHLRPDRIGQSVISARKGATRLGWTSFLVARPKTRAAGVIRIAARESPREGHAREGHAMKDTS